MFLVWRGCGQWSTDRPVVDGRIVCSCGYRRRFPLLPMFVLTGASGAGKTTIGDELLGRIGEPVVLDADILWSADMDTPGDGYARFRSTWLRVAGNLHQSGRSMLLVGSGVPDEFDRRPERRYIGPMHWMTLVCDGAVLADRLRARPGWRAVTEDRIAIMQRFNQHLRDRPDLALIDTTTREIPDTVDEVLTWIRTTQRRCGGTELESVAHGT